MNLGVPQNFKNQMNEIQKSVVYKFSLSMNFPHCKIPDKIFWLKKIMQPTLSSATVHVWFVL